jgi:hypothetical protein
MNDRFGGHFSSHRLCGSTGGSGVAPARQRYCFRAGASIRIRAKPRGIRWAELSGEPLAAMLRLARLAPARAR